MIKELLKIYNESLILEVIIFNDIERSSSLNSYTEKSLISFNAYNNLNHYHTVMTETHSDEKKERYK